GSRCAMQFSKMIEEVRTPLGVCKTKPADPLLPTVFCATQFKKEIVLERGAAPASPALNPLPADGPLGFVGSENPSIFIAIQFSSTNSISSTGSPLLGEGPAKR